MGTQKLPVPDWYKPEMGQYAATWELKNGEWTIHHFHLLSTTYKGNIMTTYLYNKATKSINAYSTVQEASDLKQEDDVQFSTKDELEERMETADMVALYNSISEKEVKKFSSKATGAKRVFAALTKATKEAEKEEKKKAAAEKKAAKKASGEPGKRGRKAEYAGQAIHLVEGNETTYREGSQRGDQFKLITDGMKVEDFQSAGGSIANLKFFILKGSVTLSGGATEATEKAEDAYSSKDTESTGEGEEVNAGAPEPTSEDNTEASTEENTEPEADKAAE